MRNLFLRLFILFGMLAASALSFAAPVMKAKNIGLVSALPTTSFIFKNNLFIGTEKGVFHLDTKTNEWQPLGKNRIGISSMVLYKGKLYAAGWDNNQAVIYRYNANTLKWVEVISKKTANHYFKKPYVKSYSDRLLVWNDKLILVNFPSGVFEYLGKNKLKQLGELSGISPTEQQALVFGNKLYVTGHNGFYQYEETHNDWIRLSRGFTSIVAYQGYIYAVGGVDNQDSIKHAVFYLKSTGTNYSGDHKIIGYYANWAKLNVAKSYFLAPSIKVIANSLFLLAPSFALTGYEPTVFELDPNNLKWKTVGFSSIPIVDLIFFKGSYYALGNNGPFSNSGVYQIKAAKPAKK